MKKTIDKHYDSQHEYKCPECNTNDIEVRAWVKLNTEEMVKFETSDDPEDIDHWCNECHTHIIPDWRTR